MAITQENIDNWFTYHSPTADQLPKFQLIRDGGRALAMAIVECTLPSADQSAAIRLVREAVMTANASISCGS